MGASALAGIREYSESNRGVLFDGCVCVIVVFFIGVWIG